MFLAALGSGPFLVIALLACPIGMGLMMLFMGRSMGMGRNKHEKSTDATADGRSLAELKAMQARLAEKIDALEERNARSTESHS